MIGSSSQQWDVLYFAAQSAALARRKEVPSLIPGSCSFLTDVYLLRWKCGQPATLDVVLTVHGTSTIHGHALSVRENRKMVAHADACHLEGIIFWWLESKCRRGHSHHQHFNERG